MKTTDKKVLDTLSAKRQTLNARLQARLTFQKNLEAEIAVLSEKIAGIDEAVRALTGRPKGTPDEQTRLWKLAQLESWAAEYNEKEQARGGTRVYFVEDGEIRSRDPQQSRLS